MTSLGYLVLARRPNPNGHGYIHEIVTMRDGTNMSVATLEGAQNVLEYCQKQNANRSINDLEDMDVTYVIGELTDWASAHE